MAKIYVAANPRRLRRRPIPKSAILCVVAVSAADPATTVQAKCALLLAQRYKDGFLAPACMQNGRKIVVDVDRAMELFNNYQNGNN